MRLPPLNALRAFEAAARHQGYIAAAEELCVSRGAISRHVKLLEAHLGVLLFKRHARGVDLTASGQSLLPVLTGAFLDIATEAKRISAASNDLRIICPPAISIRWLIPRLDQFRLRHPEVRVRLSTDFYGDSGFDAAEFDVGFSLENVPGRPADIAVLPIFPMVISPACAPGLLGQSPSLKTPSDLGDFSLLHESRKGDDWRTWLRHFRISGVDASSGDSFPNLDMAVKAAVIGSGVVMADLVLCRNEFESGTLVLPFEDLQCETPMGRYCLIGPQDQWQSPKVAAFKAWVLESIADETGHMRQVARANPLSK